MTTVWSQRSALVLSTTPPIPREYGNRNRVFQTIEFLRSLGFSVSLLLYPFDEDWESAIPSYYQELTRQFDYFAAIPNRKTLHQRAEHHHHTIDEWWDDTIGDHLKWLFRRKKFDVLFVNYTFLSKAFEFAPPHVARILDTHDLFTDRRENFERHGVEPEFFYTNKNEEKKAFDRADLIIGIKQSESEFIRTITSKHVVTLPYWCEAPDPTDQRDATPPKKFDHDRPLRLGFIGAQNSVNAVNMRRFLHVFDRYVRLYNLPVEVFVAGNVCRQLHKNYGFLKKLGRVADIQEFYRKIDAVIAPLEFSTGIKIKVGEALARELPVLATKNAFDGFRSFHRTQAEGSVQKLCHSIADLATNEIAFSELQMAAKRAARTAAKAQQKGFSELQSWIQHRLRRVVLITNRPFWYRGTYLDELIAQSVEYVAQIAPTIVGLLTDQKPNPLRVHAQAEYVHLESTAVIDDFLRDVRAYCQITGSLVFVDEGTRIPIAKQIEGCGVPCWVGEISNRAAIESVKFTRADESARSISVSALRYAPAMSNKNIDSGKVTIFLPEALSPWDELVLGYVNEICARQKLQVSQVTPPDYAEYDSEFLRKSTTDSAERIVLWDGNAIANLFLPQVARYRGVKCLLIRKSHVCPEVIDKTSGLPSLADSLESFFVENRTARAASDADTGWEEVWTAFQPH